MAAPQVAFGKEVKDVVKPFVDKFDPAMGEQVVQAGLHDVGCLTDPHSFVKFLVDDVDALDFVRLVYSDSRLSAYVGKQDAMPTNDEVLGLVEDMSLGWSASDNNAHLAVHQKRVAGRYMMLIHHALRKVKPGGEDTVEEDSEAPINSGEKSSCAAEYKLIYGEEVILSSLAHSGVLGKLYRGFSGAFPAVMLRHVFSQDDLSKGEQDRLMVFDQGGQWKEKRKTIRFPRVDYVMRALKLLMNSIVFVSATALAEQPEWKGDAWDGVVARKRRQFSRTGASDYIAFWEEYKQYYEAYPDRLVAMEYRVRKAWGDQFARKLSLEACMRKSIADWRGAVEADAHRVVAQKRPNPNPNPNPNSNKRQNPGNNLNPNPNPGPGGGNPNPNPNPNPKAAAYAKAQGQVGFDPKLKTVQQIGGKKVCKPWNQTPNKECPFPNCQARFWHKCDVKLADGSACGATDHNRLGHVAAMGGYPE